MTHSGRKLTTYIQSNAEIDDKSSSLCGDFKRLYAALDNFDIE